jgi:hypothetical protein
MGELCNVAAPGSRDHAARYPHDVLIATRVLLTAIQPKTGRLVVRRDVLSVGLAGALLLELRQLGVAAFPDGRPRLLGGEPPSDQLARWVLNCLRGDPGVGVRGWIEFLRPNAYVQVGGRLVADGVAERTMRKRGRIGARRVMFEGVDAEAHTAPAAHLRAVMSYVRDADWPEVAFFALLDMMGLGATAAAGIAAADVARMKARVREMPDEWRAVLKATRAAIALLALPPD